MTGGPPSCPCSLPRGRAAGVDQHSINEKPAGRWNDICTSQFLKAVGARANRGKTRVDDRAKALLWKQAACCYGRKSMETTGLKSPYGLSIYRDRPAACGIIFTLISIPLLRKAGIGADGAASPLCDSVSLYTNHVEHASTTRTCVRTNALGCKLQF